MAQRDVGTKGLGEMILSFLRQRGEAASSHTLAERFLKTSVNSEDLATRLLRPVLETMGAVYLDGEGWVAATTVTTSEPPPSAVFAAVVDAGAGRVHLAAVAGQAALRPLPSGAPVPAEATFVMLEPRLDAATLRHLLRGKYQSPSPSVRSLRSVVRCVVRVPRQAGLSEICAALGVRWLDTEDPAGSAVAIAACVAEAMTRQAGSEDAQAAGSGAFTLPAGITTGMLAALPESPGVYRFHDADGELLYVGKASNLRRRVSSYFTPSSARRPRRFQSRIQTMTHEVVASELEALLKEARLIERRAPSGNIQVRVHERGARYDGVRAFAVLLPDAAARIVSVILVRDGRYLGHARIGPRGGGLAAARRLLGRAVCPKPAARQSAAGSSDRDTEILRSWLARHGESASRLDLDCFTKADQAGNALAAAVRTLLAEPGVAIFR